MSRFGKTVVKLRIPILIIAVILLIPAAFGFLNTRINYDVLTYLPKDIETMKGQNILAEDFGTGAFSLVVVEGMKDTKTPYTVIENRREAIWYALENAQPGDVIILAGKGHETYQIIGKEKHHMDEREIVADYFKR